MGVHVGVVVVMFTHTRHLHAHMGRTDELVPEYVAVIVSVTAVLFFGEILPSAICAYCFPFTCASYDAAPSVEGPPSYHPVNHDATHTRTRTVSGPNQLRLGARMAPVVWCLIVLFCPIAWPISWCLDRFLGDEHAQAKVRCELA